MKVKIKISTLWMILLLLVEFIPTAAFNYYSLAIGLIFICVLFTVGYSKKIFTLSGKSLIYYCAITVLAYLVHFEGFRTFTRTVYFLAGFVAVRAIVLACVKKEKDFDSVINTIIFIFTVYALMCLYETFTGFNIFDVIFSREIAAEGANSVRFGLSRAYGLSTVSINNAMLLNLVWMLAAYRMFNAKKGQLKWTICYCIIGVSVIMSLSRMVIAVGVVTQCIMAAKCGFSWVLKRILAVVAILAILVIIFPNQFANIRDVAISMFAPFLVMFDESYAVYLDSQAQGVGERFILWSWVLGDVKQHPLFGLGYTIEFSSLSHLIDNGTTKTSIEVYWLTLIFRSGFIGLSGFVVYIVSVLRKLRKRIAVREDKKLTFRSVMFMMTVGLILFWFTCSANEELRFFYVLISLYEAYQAIGKRQTGIKSTERQNV